MPILSSLQFVRGKGPQVYVMWDSNAERSSGVSPIDTASLQALGITDKNIRYAGNISTGAITGEINSDTLKQWAQETGTQRQSGDHSTPDGIYDPNNPVQLINQGKPIGDALGKYDVNFDPTTPEQEKQNQSIQGQMQSQYSAQQASEAAAKNNPSPAAAQNSPISAAGSTTPQSQSYTIQKGDTLSALAQKNGVTVQDLLKANPQIKNPNLIYAGSQLNMPGGSNQLGAPQQDTSRNLSVTQAKPNELLTVMMPGSDGQYHSIQTTQAAYDQFYKGAGGVLAGSNGGSTNGGSTQNSGLPASADQALDHAADFMAKNDMTAYTNISPGQEAQFLQQAMAAVNPTYNQLFDQARQDMTTGLKQTSQELAANEAGIGRQYRGNMMSEQEGMASRGLADSSIRDNSERSLTMNSQAQLDTARRDAMNKALGIGTEGERKLGSSNLPTDLASISGAPKLDYGKPGVYDLIRTTPDQQIFTPKGNTYGTLEENKENATKQLEQSLKNNEYDYRGATYFS